MSKNKISIDLQCKIWHSVEYIKREQIFRGRWAAPFHRTPHLNHASTLNLLLSFVLPQLHGSWSRLEILLLVLCWLLAIRGLLRLGRFSLCFERATRGRIGKASVRKSTFRQLSLATSLLCCSIARTMARTSLPVLSTVSTWQHRRRANRLFNVLCTSRVRRCRKTNCTRPYYIL